MRRISLTSVPAHGCSRSTPDTDQFVFVRADGLSAGRRPVVVGAMTDVRVRSDAGLPHVIRRVEKLASEPERLQLCLQPVVLLLVPVAAAWAIDSLLDMLVGRYYTASERSSQTMNRLRASFAP